MDVTLPVTLSRYVTPRHSLPRSRQVISSSLSSRYVTPCHSLHSLSSLRLRVSTSQSRHVMSRHVTQSVTSRHTVCTVTFQSSSHVTSNLVTRSPSTLLPFSLSRPRHVVPPLCHTLLSRYHASLSCCHTSLSRCHTPCLVVTPSPRCSSSSSHPRVSSRLPVSLSPSCHVVTPPCFVVSPPRHVVSPPHAVVTCIDGPIQGDGQNSGSNSVRW